MTELTGNGSDELRLLTGEEIAAIGGGFWGGLLRIMRDMGVGAALEWLWGEYSDWLNSLSPDEQCNLVAWVMRGPYENPIPCGCGCGGN